MLSKIILWVKAALSIFGIIKDTLNSKDEQKKSTDQDKGDFDIKIRKKKQDAINDYCDKHDEVVDGVIAESKKHEAKQNKIADEVEKKTGKYAGDPQGLADFFNKSRN